MGEGLNKKALYAWNAATGKKVAKFSRNKNIIMKRLLFSAGIAFILGLFSCAQHDTNSPDTSGAVSKQQPGVGVDTTNASTGTQPATGPTDANHSNDNTNNNQQVNTGDTGTKKQ